MKRPWRSRLKCWLGWHEWVFSFQEDPTYSYLCRVYSYLCRVCGKRK